MHDARYLRKMINGVPVVTAPAEIAITTAGEIRAVLLKETGDGHPVVVVDMTRTLFCDASGLHTLLRAHKRAASEGGGLRLVIPADGAVSRVICPTCADHLIPCFPSLAGALGTAPARGPARLAAGAGLSRQSPGSTEEEAGLSPHAELQALSDNMLLGRLRRLPRGSAGREAICAILVDRYAGLVRSCVRPYPASPEPAEDLEQVGYVGLLKAINNFDPAYGDSLGAYAVPCISGEIKRHFRDRRSQIRVRRQDQELLLQMRAAEEVLTQRLGRTPEDGELARHLGVPEDDVRPAKPTWPSPPTPWTRRCRTVTIPPRSPASSAPMTRPWPTPRTSKPSAPTWTSCPNANSGS